MPTKNINYQVTSIWKWQGAFPSEKTQSSDKVSTLQHAMRLRKENLSASLKEQSNEVNSFTTEV